MKDLTCPYCQHEQDAYDIPEPNIIHEVECESCGKVYGVEVEYSPDYTERELPCANGGEHEWRKQNGFPEQYGEMHTCNHCGIEKRTKPLDTT